MRSAGSFDPLLFAILTVVIMGGAGWLTGKAVANDWRPLRQAIAGCIALGFADRFLVYALFKGALLSLPGFLLDTAVIVAIGAVAWRVTQARKMVTQYPWLYRHAGPFAWRRRDDAPAEVE
jgi:hypothetical protein